MAGWLSDSRAAARVAVPFFRENREDDQQIEICRPPPPQYLLSISVSGVTDAGIWPQRGLVDGGMSGSTWGNFTKEWLAVQ
jgi:hypothetical protein